MQTRVLDLKERRLDPLRHFGGHEERADGISCLAMILQIGGMKVCAIRLVQHTPAQCRHVDRGAWVVCCITHTEGALQIAVGRDDERQERYEATLVERETFEATPGQAAMIAEPVR